MGFSVDFFAVSLAFDVVCEFNTFPFIDQQQLCHSLRKKKTKQNKNEPEMAHGARFFLHQKESKKQSEKY